MRHWLWLHFTRDGREERRGAKRFQQSAERATVVARLHAARVRACSPHPNRAPAAPGGLDTTKYRAEDCLDCGTRIVTHLTKR